MDIITVEEECDYCLGAGSYEEDQGGYTSHSVNQYFIEVTCVVCKGERTVPVDVCATCRLDPMECEGHDPLPLITACMALARIQYCLECRNPTTGSIGQAGHYWPCLCQSCKNRADGVLNSQVLQQAIIVHAIDLIAGRHGS